MPPRNKPKSLYRQCLEMVHKNYYNYCTDVIKNKGVDRTTETGYKTLFLVLCPT